MTTLPRPMAKEITLCPIHTLQPYDKNPRIHSEAQVEQIAASIAEFGFTNPILIDNKKCVIAGHGRLEAARRLQLEQVPVIQLPHLTPAQQRAYRIADNKLTENGAWDFGLLEQELHDLELDDFDITLTGIDWDDFELERHEQDAREDLAKVGMVDEEQTPRLPAKPVSQLGDLWLLGKHRVLCGDATDTNTLKRLLVDKQVDLIFTDPPYNVNYQGYTQDKLTIQNDAQPVEVFKQFLHATFATCKAALKPHGSLYVCHGFSYQREFQTALESNGFVVRSQIIWAKHHFAWGQGRYKFQHEPIFYCHLQQQVDKWYGDKRQTTLWQVDKPAANRLHPTMKPIALIERALANSSRTHDVVLDLFGGSGSTLIACDKHHRTCVTLELDPRYVDVIVKRWQAWTGQSATLVESNATFDEIAQNRNQRA